MISGFYEYVLRLRLKIIVSVFAGVILETRHSRITRGGNRCVVQIKLS